MSPASPWSGGTSSGATTGTSSSPTFSSSSVSFSYSGSSSTGSSTMAPRLPPISKIFKLVDQDVRIDVPASSTSPKPELTPRGQSQERPTARAAERPSDDGGACAGSAGLVDRARLFRSSPLVERGKVPICAPPLAPQVSTCWFYLRVR